jgi:hypothetical protein
LKKADTTLGTAIIKNFRNKKDMFEKVLGKIKIDPLNNFLFSFLNQIINDKALNQDIEMEFIDLIVFLKNLENFSTIQSKGYCPIQPTDMIIAMSRLILSKDTKEEAKITTLKI